MNHHDKKVYAIRYLGSWDVTEYPHFPLFTPEVEAGRIFACFENEEDALKSWKNLEYEAGHQINFMHMVGYDGVAFNLKEFGFESVESLWKQLQTMNANELFEFSQKVSCYIFFMYEYPAELKMKTLYDLQNREYFSYDGTTHEDYVSNIFLYINDYISIAIKGSLKELTDTPFLLNELIEQNSNVDYDSQNHILNIKPDEKTLNSVNALLKNPLYEIRYLTIQEIYEIEQMLNHTEPR